MEDKMKEAAELLALHKDAVAYGSSLKGIADAALARVSEINREIEAQRRVAPVGQPATLRANPVEPVTGEAAPSVATNEPEGRRTV